MDIKSMFYNKGILEEHEFVFSSNLNCKLSVGEFVFDKTTNKKYVILGVKMVFNPGEYNTDRSPHYIKYLIEETIQDV